MNPSEGGAGGGAIQGEIDSELSKVVGAWATLPDALRQAILAIVGTQSKG